MRVQLESIFKRFGAVVANDGISMTLEPGIIQGLLGENGAGKSTLMKVLSGYQPPDGGRILLDGRQVAFRSPADAIQAGIGMMHQDPLDIPPLTVLDNFVLGRSLSLWAGRAAARRELGDLCQRFGFHLDADALNSNLTMGERQQLELARLLSLGVRVVILDEPTTGISAPQRALLFATLKRLATEGLSVVFVSHKLDEVEALCDQVAVLRRGELVGTMSAPLSSKRIVSMMFGQGVTESTRPNVALGTPVLVLENVSARDHRLRIENISLSVRSAEVIGFAGLEGSGQRLLLSLCAGLHRASAGRILIDGRDVSHRPYRDFGRAGVGFVPAARLEEGMIKGMTIREHVALTAPSDGFFVGWRDAETRAERMIEAFNVVGRPETPVEALSGGNQQRALLAMLPQTMRLLIMEHPTRGLDVESSRWVWNRLLHRRSQGTAILFTSTDLDEIVEYSDRIAVFSGGMMAPPVSARDVTRDELGHLVGGKRA